MRVETFAINLVGRDTPEFTLGKMGMGWSLNQESRTLRYGECQGFLALQINALVYDACDLPGVSFCSGGTKIDTRHPALTTIRHVGGNFDGVGNRSGHEPEAVHGSLRFAG